MSPRIIRFLILLALFLGPARASLGLDTDRGLIELHLQTWQTQQGLPHNMVQAIAQTPDGYLWFGTWEGVARFNGFEFTVFDPYNAPALRDRGVRALLVASDGALWMGTSRGGVTRYHQGEWATFTRDEGLSGDEVLSLAEDNQGRIWVGTEADGVTLIDGSPGLSFGTAEGLHDKAVLAMVERVPGEMWLTNRSGVVRIIGDQVQAFGPADGLPTGPVLSVVEGPNDTLLFGTQDGVYQWDGEAFTRDSAWARSGQGQVSELLCDSDGALWAGTFADGMFRSYQGRVESLKTRSGLPNNRVTAIFEDREGNLWIGTSSGLARLKSAPFSVLDIRNGLEDNYVRSVMQARDGSFWIGTSNGLSQVVGTETRTFTTEHGLTSNSILSLFEHQDGSLWVGTYGAGINLFRDGRTETVISAPETLPSNHIRSMLETRDGSIWVGTIAGLTQFRDGQAVQTLDDENGLPREYIQALFEDIDGTLWIGTVEGLARIREGQVQALNDVIEGYDGSDVFDFHRDAIGNLWIATETGLLHLGSDDIARPVKRLHGLPHEVLFGLDSDALGYLWMSSNAGIFRARIEDLLDVVHGRRGTARVDRYGEDHGLASRQANGGSQPSVIRASSGRLWFATAVGAAVIDPQILATEVERQIPPSVVVEGVLVDGQPQDLEGRISISPGARHFEFHYAGLSFRSPENIRYRYQLEGFESPQDVGSQRVAHYTNLDPGEYAFMVWAAHPQGTWSPTPDRVLIEVLPHFYETRWFIAGIALLVVLVVSGGVRLRITSLRSRAAELTREVASRTRELEDHARRLERANAEKTRLLEKLEEQSRAFEALALEDALTGLANRRHFDEILAREFERAKKEGLPLSVAIMDLDRFKQINDGFSHQAGDDVLKIVAGKLRQTCEGQDVAARYGGEEFVMVFPGRTGAEVRERCERLRESVEQQDYSHIARGLTATLSIGISDRLDVANHEKVVSDADGKLYRAKTEGRNRVVF